MTGPPGRRERAGAAPALRRVMGPKLLLLFIIGDILGTGIYALTGDVADHGWAQEYAEGEKPFIRERITGSFTRKVYLSDTVDADHIEAGFEAGVLTVRIPVAEQAKPRKIEVHTDAKAIKA